jgi:hypothetical protein
VTDTQLTSLEAESNEADKTAAAAAAMGGK